MYIVFLLQPGGMAGWPAALTIETNGLELPGTIGVGTVGGVPPRQFGVHPLGAAGQFIIAAPGTLILLPLAGLLERN